MPVRAIESVLVKVIVKCRRDRRRVERSRVKRNRALAGKDCVRASISERLRARQTIDDGEKVRAYARGASESKYAIYQRREYVHRSVMRQSGPRVRSGR